MSDAPKIVAILLIMVVLFFFARKFSISQMQKAGIKIINDLKEKGAVNANSAVELTYSSRNYLRIGFRDDRPKVLKQLVQLGVVDITENGHFYLNESHIPDLLQD